MAIYVSIDLICAASLVTVSTLMHNTFHEDRTITLSVINFFQNCKFALYDQKMSIFNEKPFVIPILLMRYSPWEHLLNFFEIRSVV